MERKFLTPEYVTGEKIKEVRKKLGYTQKDFARLLGCSKPTIERWERSSQPITGPVTLVVTLFNAHPELISKIELPKKTYPIRLHYMHKEKLCTIIDVDEVNRKVKIFNYTDNMIFRAFGVIENPDFDEYTEFLKSRCFPETRDKLKLVLRELDLPFYDPFLIIEKTEGRMAEDNFWIKIER